MDKPENSSDLLEPEKPEEAEVVPAKKQWWRPRGYECTAEEKALHSEKMKAWWAAKRLREGVKEKKKGFSDEERKNRSERKKAWWANARERMADSLPDRVEQREQKAKPRVSSITGRAIGAELRQERDDKKRR